MNNEVQLSGTIIKIPIKIRNIRAITPRVVTEQLK